LGLTPDEQYALDLKAWETKKTSMGYACGSTKAAWAASVATINDAHSRANAAYITAYQAWYARKKIDDQNKATAKSLGTQYGFTPPASGCITAAQKSSYADACARASTVLRGLGASSTVPACGQAQLPVCGEPVGVKPVLPVKPKLPPEPTCPAVPPPPEKPKAPVVSSPPIIRSPTPVEESSSLMVGGLLGLLVAGGVGYYVYKRHKKKGAAS
jgi:hypothetical protein